MANGADSWVAHMPRELVEKFAAARRRVRLVILAKGWTLLLFALCMSVGASIVLDRLFFLESPYRLALFLACLVAVGGFLIGFLVLPLLRRISARGIARSLEEKHPELGDLLLSTVELSEQLANGERYTSEQMIAAVSRETARRTRTIDFRSAVPFSVVRKPLLITLGIVCPLALYCYFWPMVAANVVERVLYPYSGPPPLTFTELIISPGDAKVPTGADLAIKGMATGKVPEKGLLYLRRKGGGWQKTLLRKRGGGEFRYTLKGLVAPVSYAMKVGDARSDTFRISVSDRPVIVGIEVNYTYPEYTGRPAEKESEGGDIAAVRGSRVQITANANKPLESAKLRFGDGTQSLVSIRGSTIVSQALEVKTDDSYSFELVDTDGFSNVETISYRIHAVEDKPPVVAITKPERYSDAMPDEIVAVGFRAVDDFGNEKVWLEYTIRSGELKEEKDTVPGEERKGILPINIGEERATEVEGEYALSLAGLGAKVGEIVVLRAVSEDNNLLSGPGRGVSAEHTIRIVSSDASFRKIEQEQQDLTRRLLRLLSQQKENKKTVDSLLESLKGKETPSEGEKGALDEAKSIQRTIEDSGRQLAEDFAGTLERMRTSPMIQPRSVIEMADVTRALGNVSAKEMPEATQTASEAAASQEAKGRQEKLSETSALQEKIIKALEQAAGEFAKLQDEQKMLSLADAASKLAREQETARAQTAAAIPELAGLFPEKLTEEQKRRLKKLVEAQEKLRGKLSEFEERLRTLRKQLEYANASEAQMIASALKYFEQGAQPGSLSIPKDASDAVEALRANHLHKGVGSQTRVYESLLKLAEEFRKAQAARLQGEFSNTAQGLQLQEPEIDQLIEIQKGIIGQTEKLPKETDEKGVEGTAIRNFENIGELQKDLRRRTGNFRAILEEIFQNLVLMEIDPVTPLKESEKAMGGATENLGRLKAGAALTQETNSLRNLEKARDELAKAMARMMANANLQQAMRAMSVVERMIVEQKKVNDGTARLDKDASEKKAMTDPMLEALRQLVNQQTALKDRATSLKNYLKMMTKAGEMMGESENLLKNKQTGQQTQKVQGQILELLVQMLVSLRAEANAQAQAMGLPGSSGTGAHGGIVTEPILRAVPEMLNDRWANLPPRMKQELLEAWEETFSPEFRELIALYYKQLSGKQGSR